MFAGGLAIREETQPSGDDCSGCAAQAKLPTNGPRHLTAWQLGDFGSKKVSQMLRPLACPAGCHTLGKTVLDAIWLATVPAHVCLGQGRLCSPAPKKEVLFS